MIRTVAIYARVSTQRQATEGASIEEQVRRLEALAERKGWTVAGRYVDAGQSGRTTAGRAQFQAMIEAAERAGTIVPGRTTIIEPTSGNTGIALAMAGGSPEYLPVLVAAVEAALEERQIPEHPQKLPCLDTQPLWRL